MFKRSLAAGLVVACLSTVNAVRRFQPIDWEKLEEMPDKPIQLETKTFTDEGFDPASEILKQGDIERQNFDKERNHFMEESVEIKKESTQESKGITNDVDHTLYVPKLKRLDID